MYNLIGIVTVYMNNSRKSPATKIKLQDNQAVTNINVFNMVNVNQAVGKQLAFKCSFRKWLSFGRIVNYYYHYFTRAHLNSYVDMLSLTSCFEVLQKQT